MAASTRSVSLPTAMMFEPRSWNVLGFLRRKTENPRLSMGFTESSPLISAPSTRSGSSASSVSLLSVLDVSPNLLSNPVGKDDSAEANRTRIAVLRAVVAVTAMPDTSASPPLDVVRFARAFSVVRGSGDDAAIAANAIGTNALTLESYNVMVGLLERDAQFRARVNTAIENLDKPLSF